MKRCYGWMIGAALAAVSVAAGEAVAALCELENGCPELGGPGGELIEIFVELDELPPGTTYDNADLDNAPATVMLDRYELALFREALCNGGAFSQDAICAYNANRSALQAEVLQQFLGPYAGYVLSMLSISSEHQAAITALGLGGQYVVAGAGAKAAGEPFSPSGDPDADGYTNQQEYDNVIAEGGSEADYTEAALNPFLDGTAASVASLPLAGAPGAGALAAMLACAGLGALRRKRK